VRLRLSRHSAPPLARHAVHVSPARTRRDSLRRRSPRHTHCRASLLSRLDVHLAVGRAARARRTSSVTARLRTDVPTTRASPKLPRSAYDRQYPESVGGGGRITEARPTSPCRRRRLRRRPARRHRPARRSEHQLQPPDRGSSEHLGVGPVGATSADLEVATRTGKVRTAVPTRARHVARSLAAPGPYRVTAQAHNLARIPRRASRPGALLYPRLARSRNSADC